jgi:hypothetical protein
MKITDLQLTQIEQKGILPIQSSLRDTVYAIDKRNGVLWLIDRRTGAQIGIAVENVHALADELISVVEVHMPQKNLWKVG